MSNPILSHYYVLLQGFQEFLDNHLFSDVKLVFKDNQMLFLHKLLKKICHFGSSYSVTHQSCSEQWLRKCDATAVGRFSIPAASYDANKLLSTVAS